MSIAVEFQDVVKRFPNAVENAVDHVSFQIQEKEMITILGTSGCGKTTLMKMINRLYDPTSGEIHVFGEISRRQIRCSCAEKSDMLFSRWDFFHT